MLHRAALSNAFVRHAWTQAGVQYVEQCNEAVSFDAMALALTDALRDDMKTGLPLSALLASMYLISAAATAQRTRHSPRLAAAAELVEELLCTYCIKLVVPFRVMLKCETKLSFLHIH